MVWLVFINAYNGRPGSSVFIYVNFFLFWVLFWPAWIRICILILDSLFQIESGSNLDPKHWVVWYFVSSIVMVRVYKFFTLRLIRVTHIMKFNFVTYSKFYLQLLQACPARSTLLSLYFLACVPLHVLFLGLLAYSVVCSAADPGCSSPIQIFPSRI